MDGFIGLGLLIGMVLSVPLSWLVGMFNPIGYFREDTDRG